MAKSTKQKLSVPTFLGLGYLITILIGTILLLIPAAANDKTSFIDALFTATSATCVTGLTTKTTAEHWSVFGQIVILCLIQIGGLGFMTIITLIFMTFKKKISLYQRAVLMQSSGSYTISEVVKLIKTILLGSCLFEVMGALILMIPFCKEYGAKGIYYGIFHSVSAFCNAGFDIIGNASLTPFKQSPTVLITISMLIMIGGSGFIIWHDVLKKKFKFKNYELHSKIVIIFNSILILMSTLAYVLFEAKNAFKDMTPGYQLLNSFFMAVTPRTAGFNAVNINDLKESSKLLTIILMFIGGNSGSTAGGLKVTTIIVIIANLFAQAKNSKTILMFKRAIPVSLVQNAASLVLAYSSLVFFSTILICAGNADFTIGNVLFEVTSAIGTVGLTSGITAGCNILQKLILIFLMFSGRIGAYTLFDIIVRNKNEATLNSPLGKVLVG